jgi:hypothetical protein
VASDVAEGKRIMELLFAEAATELQWLLISMLKYELAYAKKK